MVFKSVVVDCGCGGSGGSRWWCRWSGGFQWSYWFGVMIGG
jgi:hypothetical protein